MVTAGLNRGASLTFLCGKTGGNFQIETVYFTSCNGFIDVK